MRRTTTAGHVLAAGLTGLMLAMLLNAQALERTASGLPLGLERSVALAVIRPVASFSSALYLDRPRRALDSLLGRGEVPEPSSTPAPASHGVDTTVREPSNREPLDAWIVGDSLVELVGPHLSNRFEESELVSAEVDFRFISGLSRPDYFDWPAHLRTRMQAGTPELVVAMFGGNDGQNVALDGTTYVAWTKPWFDLYHRRVGEVMDALRADHLRAYWIGLPVMKSETFSRHARRMNEVYRAEAARRPWMRYIDTWDVFTDASGRYADYLPNARGELRLMRYADGVHFTPSGAVRLVGHAYEVIERDWPLPA